MRPLLFVLSVTALSTAFAADDDAPRGIVPSDFYEEESIEQTAIAPDGSLLAFTLMSVVEENNKRHREIWMQRLKNGSRDGDPFRFTNPTVNASGPQWSPDGTVLSFQSKRGDDDNTTWFMRVAAPGGEAYHIEGVDAAPIWSPDMSFIAYTKSPEDEEEPKKDDANTDETAEKKPKKKKVREGWVAPDALTSTLDEKRFDGRVYTTMRMKRDGTQQFLAHTSARNKRQLFVTAASGGDAAQLTDLPFDVGDVQWAADGHTLLFTGDEKQDDEYNEDFTRQIYTADVRNGSVRPLPEGDAVAGSAPDALDPGETVKITEGLGNEMGLAVSPDRKRLAYLFSPERGAQTDLYVVDIAVDGSFQGEPKNLTPDWDYGPGRPTWAGSNRALRFSTGYHGNSHIFEVDLDGDITQITQGDRSLRAVSYADDARYMAYAATDPTHPSDLYVARKDGSREEGIMSPNADWLANIIRMPAERIAWTVDDGTEVEGWVIKPVNYSPGVKEYPMILKIHGGPHSAYGNYWFRTFHVLSNAGFFVFYPNPRGSSGYGHDFTYATRGQWGIMDSEDYLKGVDAVVAKYPDIDPDRVGVSGGSYGGFMSAWLSATTDRFAAANPSRMICNWDSWYGASDAQGLTEFEFDGKPWEVRELYRQLSPLSYVENVATPTLIIHSENDYRTPIADGEQWYIALKKRGVPVEMVRYPRSSHGLSRSGEPWLLVDRLERLKTWFTHWLIDEELTHHQANERWGS